VFACTLWIAPSYAKVALCAYAEAGSVDAYALAPNQTNNVSCNAATVASRREKRVIVRRLVPLQAASPVGFL